MSGMTIIKNRGFGTGTAYKLDSEYQQLIRNQIFTLLVKTFSEVSDYIKCSRCFEKTGRINKTTFSRLAWTKQKDGEFFRNNQFSWYHGSKLHGI